MSTNNVVRLDSAVRAPILHPDDARQAHNRIVGLRLIAAGIPVFVSLDKTSFIPKWTKLDTDLTEADREDARQTRKARGLPMPTIIGSTLTPELWKRMLKLTRRNGTASICCGLAKIVVIDADRKDGIDGPALLADYLEKHGGLPEGTLILESQSGARHYVFADREGRYSNSEGEINRVLGCNVRGVGGQIVAPASWRADGKRYGTLDDLQRFIDAITQGTLPELPQCLADLIGERSGQTLSDSDSQMRSCIAELENDEWPEFEEVFGPSAALSVERLKRGTEKFCELMNNPGSDHSGNRLSLASTLKGASSRATVRHFATFCTEYPDIFGTHVDKNEGPGTYDDRNLSRDWVRATPANVPMSDGGTFDAVDEESQSLTDRITWLATEIDQAEAALALGEVGAEDRLAMLKDFQSEVKSKLDSKAESATGTNRWYESAINIPIDLDINALPPRPFLYGKYLMRGHVTLLTAAGGVGKSVWTLDSAIDLACGVDHLGAGEFKSRKVLVYNGEDDQDEMLRRIGAEFEHHKFTPEMRARVRDNLTIISGVKASMRLAEYRDGRVVLKEKAFEKLVEIIEGRNIDIVILDPLIAPHSIPENANAEMNTLMVRFKNLAAAKLIALLLAHHDKKNIGNKSLEDANQDDARGAGTITTPVRVVLNLRRVSKRDAQVWRIPPEDPPRIIALSAGAKSNYSARDVTPKLFYANSVQADNGTDEFEADSTVALSAYTLPNRPDGDAGIGDEATLAVLAALDGNEPVGSDTRHANWIGRLIADAAGWDLEAKHVRDSIRGIIANWTAREWIIEAVLEASGKGAERRKSVKVYKRGASRPAPRVYEFGPVDDGDDEA